MQEMPPNTGAEVLSLGTWLVLMAIVLLVILVLVWLAPSL
jgi:hypothetical protein